MALIFVCLAAGIVAAGYFYYGKYEKHYRSAVERQLSAIADLKVGELVRWRKERLGDGAMLFRNAAFSSLVRRVIIEKQVNPEAQHQLQTWVEKYQTANEYDNVRLLDAQGVARISVPTDRAPMSSTISRRIPEVLRSGQMAFQDFYRNEHDQRVYLAVLVPILAESEASPPLGVLVLRIDPETYLYPLLKRWPTPSLTAETLLVRREGNEVVFLNELRFGKNTTLTLRRALDQVALPAARAALKQEGIMEGIDYRGVPVVAALRIIPDSPWSLVARMDAAEVYAPLRERLWLMVALIGVVLFGAGAGIALLWRQQRVRFYRERHEATGALRESEERFRILFEEAADIVIQLEITPAGMPVIRDANSATFKILGYERDELIGQPVSAIEAAPDASQAVVERRRNLLSGMGTMFETTHRCKDGTIRDFECSVTEMQIGAKTSAISVERDITERKRAEEALRKSERRYQSLAEVSPVGIFRTDAQGQTTYVNPRWCEISGLSVADALGDGWLRAVHPEDREKLAQGWQVAAEAHRTSTGEYRFIHSDGTLAWVMGQAVPEKDQAGRIVGYVGTVTDITESRKTDVALRESQAFYHSLVAQLPAGVFRKDREGRYVFVSPWFCRLKGMKQEEFLGRTPPEVAASETAKRDPTGRAIKYALDGTDQHARIMQTGNPVELVEEYTDSAGRKQFVHALKSPVFGSAGEIIGTQGILFDITVRKQAEEALRQEQALFNNLASTIPDHIYFKDRKSRFVRINASMAQRFGLRDPAEAVGKTDFDLFSEEHARQAYEGEQRIMATGEPIIGLVEKETWPDGHVTWVSTTKVPLRDADSNITGLVGISRDITEHKQAEERIREQAALLDNANDAIYVTTLDCTVLYWNRGAERIYGWTSAEALNQKTTELISPDPAAAEALAAILLKDEGWSGERRQITKSGGMVEVFSRLTLVRNEAGQPQSVFAINTDITEKKQLEAQYLRAQRLENIGALASGIAHDLNNVLAPIVMGAPLLQEMVKDETARHLVKMIETSAQRGAAIVKQVLTFARGVEGERVPLQPRHLLAEMDELAAGTFPKSIRVESDAAADLWPVLGDATQLHQVLLNLCINARDAMPGGGVLTLQAANVVLSREAAEKMPGARPGSFVCLRVTDTGTGIPPEIEAKIFEPFFTTKVASKGTGLGLSTVRGIVRSHGGFLRVASKVGQGTTFELYLPATKAEQVAVKKASATPWPHALGEGILLVDDEAAVREVARQALVEFGYEVITTGRGSEALRIFQERRQEIQLVLTDMLMPEMDGPTLIAALRVLDPAVKIVGITGMGDTTGMSGLKTLALSAVLTKPFTIKDLLRVIREALPAKAGSASAVPVGGGSRPAPPG